MELNSQNYYSHVFPNIRDYYLLDKADGVRTFIVVRGNDFTTLNNKLTTYKLSRSYGEMIADAEYVEHNGVGKCYVFDVLCTMEKILQKHQPATESNLFLK